jgi:outer membrane protein
MLFFLRTAVFTAVLFLLRGPLLAGEDIRSSSSMPSASWVGGPTDVLTLDQAIEMALTNNLDAQIDHVGIQIANARMRYAWGEFDPVLNINTTREYNQSPQNPSTISTADAALQERQFLEQAQFLALLQGQTFTAPPVSSEPFIFQQNATRLGSNVQGKLIFGTTYRLNAEVDYLKSSIRDFDQQFLPTNSGVVALTLDQPLLRDFGIGTNLAGVRISRRDRKVAFYTWKGSVINAVTAVMGSYCDMVYALQTVRVREEAIEADKRLVAGNQRRLDVGLMSPIDVRQAQVALSEDQDRLIQARSFFMERQFALKRQILKEFESGENRTFMPLGSVNLGAPPLDRTMLLQDAFAHRTDYLSAIEQAERENIRLRYARNQMLPKIDVVGSLGYAGLSTESGIRSSFNSTVPTWSVGLQASIPFGNIQQRAQYNIARGQKEQAVLKIKQTELTVSVDVDTVISRIRTAQQSAETTRQARKLAEEALRIQMRRIEQGQISSFELIDTQRRLYDARAREIDARNTLDKSIVQLGLATGTTLENRGINVLDDVKSSRPATQTKVNSVR